VWEVGAGVVLIDKEVAGVMWAQPEASAAHSAVDLVLILVALGRGVLCGICTVMVLLKGWYRHRTLQSCPLSITSSGQLSNKGIQEEALQPAQMCALSHPLLWLPSMGPHACCHVLSMCTLSNSGWCVLLPWVYRFST
jgi:hypothetical protein